MLDDDLIERVVAEAKAVLAGHGVTINNRSVIEMLGECGAEVDRETQRVRMPEAMIGRAVAEAPATVELTSVGGQRSSELAGLNVHFVPGSSALVMLDSDARAVRTPVTHDYVTYARLVDRLDNIAFQSTAFITGDVPEQISDSYRLFLSLLYGDKPVVTGGFRSESFSVMKDLLLAVRGSEESLAERPPAVFSCCITSPLKWSDVTSHYLVECARAGIPVEIISMPMAGLSSPVTLVGTLIQHAAEVISGVVISESVKPGSPVLFGGSTAIVDMRYATAPMGAIESMMLGCAYAEIGRHLGIPTQAYAGLTDAKEVDGQGGAEASMGAVMAALAGINSISGPGMIDYQKCFSLEKLVLDNEVCGMALRLLRGVAERDDFPLTPRLEELETDGHLLMSDHTLRHLRHEQYLPGPVMERAEREKWEGDGRADVVRRAQDEIGRLAAGAVESKLPTDMVMELKARMRQEAEVYNMGGLPELAR